MADEGNNIELQHVEHHQPETMMAASPEQATAPATTTTAKPVRTGAQLVQDIVALFKGRDRSLRYEPFLEILPNWFIIIILCVVLCLLIGTTAIAVFAAPDGYGTNTVTHTSNLDAVYNGSQPIMHQINDLNPNNLAFLFSMTFLYNRTYVGVLKDNLKLKVMLQARNSDTEEWRNFTSGLTEQSRSLLCSQTSLSWLASTFFSGWVQDCRSINIFYERYIGASQYRAIIFVTNLKDVYNRKLILGPVETNYTYTAVKYTVFELVFRILFCLFTVFQFVTFFITVLRAQWYKKWHTSQKWLVVLLFMEIFFHDPIFFAQAFLGFFLFPILNILFTLTFAFTFLLYLLIFFHSLFKKPAERTFCSFYMTKILVVAPIYIIVCVLFIWSRLYNYADSTYSSISDVPGYLYMEAIAIILLGIYVVALLYYVFRAIGAASQKKISKKFSSRFKVVGAFSFLVLISLAGTSLAREAFRYNAPSLTFLVSHFIIFTYFTLLSLFFLPSSRVSAVQSASALDSQKKQQELQQQQQQDDDDGRRMSEATQQQPQQHHEEPENTTLSPKDELKMTSIALQDAVVPQHTTSDDAPVQYNHDASDQ